MSRQRASPRPQTRLAEARPLKAVPPRLRLPGLARRTRALSTEACGMAPAVSARRAGALPRRALRGAMAPVRVRLVLALRRLVARLPKTAPRLRVRLGRVARSPVTPGVAAPLLAILVAARLPGTVPGRAPPMVRRGATGTLRAVPPPRVPLSRASVRARAPRAVPLTGRPKAAPPRPPRTRPPTRGKVPPGPVTGSISPPPSSPRGRRGSISRPPPSSCPASPRAPSYRCGPTRSGPTRRSPTPPSPTPSGPGSSPCRRCRRSICSPS